MSSVIGDWKRFHAGKNRVTWQEGYSITGCELLNAASSFQQRWIHSAKSCNR